MGSGAAAVRGIVSPWAGSRNGTFLNGRQLEPEKEEELRDGDRLRLSDEDFLFRVDGGTEERR